MQCDDETMTTLVEASGGDMRRAITSLQSCSKLKGPGVPISVGSVLEVTGVIFKTNTTVLLLLLTPCDFLCLDCTADMDNGFFGRV